MNIHLLLGDCRSILSTLEVDSVHSCVTDPPYELGFMGKQWDRSGVAFAPETWQAVYRALKPGGHLLAFGGTRTFHRMTVAIEDAGFEIRDCLSWLYGSGFPKSHNLEGEWDGWGTALKPAWEPIIMARKPFRGTVAANVTTHQTGAINVDGCRIESDGGTFRTGEASQDRRYTDEGVTNFAAIPGPQGGDPSGRWPANVVIDEDAAAAIDGQSGTLTSGANPTRRGSNKFNNTFGEFAGQADCTPARGVDIGGASRFYYCAKASRTEREIGMDGVDAKPMLWSAGEQNPGSFQSEGTNRTTRNNHPTVKPISLMQWLVRMVTPPGGVVLDPFMGSGSTGIAAAREGFHFTGIELSPDYLEIARRRIHGDAPLLAGIA